MDEYEDTPLLPGKVRHFSSKAELLAKLDGRAAMWARTARENQERAEDFEAAAKLIRQGAKSVNVGRTFYVLDPAPEAEGE